jgi:CubicO group peptidase (beta-lactamase class C family)
MDIEQNAAAGWTRREVLRVAGLGAVGLAALGPLTAATQTSDGEMDGWPTGAPEAYGIDPAALAEVNARAPTETPDLSALLVIRHGVLVWEGTYGGYDPARAIDVRSVTKSVTGTLTGIALDEGTIADLQQTVGDLIPDRIPADADPAVANVTIWQLLTMTSGLAWDAATDWPTLIASDDWIAMTLSLPVTGVPGQTYVYNTGGSHLLGVMVAAAVGEPLERFAQSRLFAPLDIQPDGWMRSPQGEVNGGSGLRIRPHEMAKLGQLYLRQGAWGDARIVSAAYVADATRWQSAGDATGGWAGYGYQWWITATDAGYPAYFALGYGGQHIFVVPDLDLVVVAAIERRVPAEALRTPRYLIERIAAGTTPA